MRLAISVLPSTPTKRAVHCREIEIWRPDVHPAPRERPSSLGPMVAPDFHHWLGESDLWVRANHTLLQCIAWHPNLSEGVSPTAGDVSDGSSRDDRINTETHCA